MTFSGLWFGLFALQSVLALVGLILAGRDLRDRQADTVALVATDWERMERQRRINRPN